MRFRRLLWIALLLISLVAACGGSDDDNNGSGDNDQAPEASTDVPAPQSQTATAIGDVDSNPTLPPTREVESTSEDSTAGERSELRIVHGIEGVPLVDVLLDGELVVRAQEAYTATTRTIRRPPGVYTLQVVDNTPRGQEDDATVYIEETVDLAESQDLIYILSGSAENAILLTFEERLSPLEPQQSRVILVNAMPELMGVNLELGPTLLAEGVAYGEASESVILPAEEQEFDLVQDEINLTTMQQALETGRVYTIVLVGDQEADLFVPVILENETSPQSRVRVTHAVPDLPAVRILLDDEPLVDALSFAETQEFTLVPSGNYTAQVLDALDGTVLLEQRIKIDPYVNAEMVFFGTDASPELDVFPIDSSAVTDEVSRLTVIHAASGVGRLALISPEGIDYGLSVRYGRQETIEIVPEAAEFRFVTGGLEDPELVEAPLDAIDLEMHLAYTYIVTGRSEENPILLDFEVRTSGETPEDEVNAFNLMPVQVINAWPDPVRLELGDQRVAAGLAYGAISQPVQVVIDYYPVRLLDTEGNLLVEDEVFLREDADSYTFFVFSDGSQPVIHAVQDDLDIPGPTTVRVRFVHAHPDLPQVVVTRELDYVPEGPDDDTDQELSFGDISPQFELPGGLLQFEIFNRETFDTIATFEPVDLIGGEIYEFLIVPAGDGTPDLIIITRRAGT